MAQDASKSITVNRFRVSFHSFVWLFALILSGCAVISKKLIDSPSAKDGHPIRLQLIHEEVKSGSSSEAIWVSSMNDSNVILKLQPKAIKNKTTWFGFVFPVFPAFFIPAENYYSDSDSLLKISFWVKSNTNVQVYPDSSMVIIEGKKLLAIKSSIWGVHSEPQDSRGENAGSSRTYTYGYNVWFPIDARKVSKYEIKVKVENNGLVDFPRIVCTRKWKEKRFFVP